METQRFWQLRANLRVLERRLNIARIGTASRAEGVTALFGVGSRALLKSTALLALPLLILVGTQSVVFLGGRMPSWVAELPNWLEGLVSWLTAPVPESFDSAALPTAALQVAGVFVAVYFATVTFVVSSTYKDATKELRSLIVRQPESRWYALFFTQAVVYVALVISLPLIDRTATHLTLVLAGLSAALVVLSFGQIWITLFLLLEPTTLLRQVRRDLRRGVDSAYKLGRRKGPSVVAIQRANDRIRNSLGTLNDLVSLILDREHERIGDRGISASFDPRIGAVVGNLLGAWDIYSQHKHSIRTLQGWNPKRTQSKDWFLASQPEVSVALATGTNLSGSEVHDDLWFERWLGSFVERSLDGRSLRSIANILDALPPFSRALGARGQFEELRLWLTSTTFAAMSEVSSYAGERGAISVGSGTDHPAGPRLSREQHLALPGEGSAHALVDHVLTEVLSASLGYLDYFERMRRALPTLAPLIADESQRLVAGKLPVELTANLRKALAAELRLEGQRVTPDAALTQLAARALATEAVDEVENFVGFLESEIWPWVIEIAGSKSWAGGSGLSRATELTEKLGTMLRSQRQLLEACEAVHVEKDDRWPSTDTSSVLARAFSLKEQLELPVSRLAATVDSSPDIDRPDHFGWAYYRAHENVLTRVLTRTPGAENELREKVVLLYLAVETATQRLMATVRRNDLGIINSYVAEPYLRFMQLSGIALVVSEVTEDRALFAPFDSLWTNLLADDERATALLGRAAATLASQATLYGFTSGGVDRSNIEIRANKALDELGVPRRLFDLPGLGFAEESTAPSLTADAMRILRAVRLSDYETMFYARWLRPLTLSKGAQAPVDLERHLLFLGTDEEVEDD